MHSSYSSGDHGENLTFVFETLSRMSGGATEPRMSRKRSRTAGSVDLRKLVDLEYV
ncbi:hypothetical protein IMZ48_25075 [Candidatus Bathyarchaeota archaeon]|nr:hypothetical protein [Candidatus Bathyarchaeota archaeon]